MHFFTKTLIAEREIRDHGKSPVAFYGVYPNNPAARHQPQICYGVLKGRKQKLKVYEGL
jgi:hypothetical protein